MQNKLFRMCRALARAGVLVIACAALAPAFAQQSVLRVVPQANLTVLDPIWTTAYVTRNHAYMIYDTLFGTDDKGKIQPQMVERFSVSEDGKTWTFELREGLQFHDGKPVTADDVIASLKRWAARDSMGGALASFVDSYQPVSERGFKINLKEPFGLMLEALGKPSSNVPFIMPKRVAETPADKQISEHIGSGPHIFKADEFKPGEKIVYLKNPNYRPRAEPASGTAGGKQVYVDRVEWVIIRDPQTQLNALLRGEVDMVEQPAHEQYGTLRASPDIQLIDQVNVPAQFMLRFNHLHPPFNNVKVRQAAMLALGQEPVLRTQVGVQGMYKFCRSWLPCGTALASENTGIYTGVADFAKAKKLLAESGYNNEPVVLMRPTDLAAIAKIPLVASQQLKQAGFNVDLQTMDWSTLLARRAKKDPPSSGGWNIFMTTWSGSDLLNPISNPAFNASGDSAWFGWVKDDELTAIRNQFIRATSDAEKKRLAEVAQLRAVEIVTHVPLGEYTNPAAARKNISGVVGSGAALWYGIKKN